MCGSVRVNSHRLSIPETAQLKLESEIVRHPLASHGEDTERVQKQGERVLSLDSGTTCRNLLHVVLWRDQHRYRIGGCQARWGQPESDCCRRRHRLREQEWGEALGWHPAVRRSSPTLHNRNPGQGDSKGGLQTSWLCESYPICEVFFVEACSKYHS